MYAYHQLLDAMINHLEDLKRSGTKFVAVSPEALAQLGKTQSTLPPAAQRPRMQAPRSVVTPVAAPASAPAQKRTAEPIVLSSNLDKAAAIQELRERALVCQKCPSL